MNTMRCSNYRDMVEIKLENERKKLLKDNTLKKLLKDKFLLKDKILDTLFYQLINEYFDMVKENWYFLNHFQSIKEFIDNSSFLAKENNTTRYIFGKDKEFMDFKSITIKIENNF